MPSAGERVPLQHPHRAELELVKILHALADPTRLHIVSVLAWSGERSCGTFDVAVRPSTLSHHFRVLREAGVIRQTQIGRERRTSLRSEDLQDAFPGLMTAILRSLSPSATPPPPAT